MISCEIVTNTNILSTFTVDDGRLVPWTEQILSNNVAFKRDWCAYCLWTEEALNDNWNSKGSLSKGGAAGRSNSTSFKIKPFLLRIVFTTAHNN
jgi:hypothetical protein